ncbi:MAG: DUF4266 domain-containing protein [Deltaproteobacteria bacterium]|nr:DUF4266 domain-containing protein [Deltaproteobacteria bacterium]
MNNRLRFLAALAVFVALALGAGCAVVAPYERAALADPILTLDESDLAGLYEMKMLETREAGLAAIGGAAAGCGCK